MSKHTPGPWNLSAGRHIETQSGEFYIAYHKNEKTGKADFPDFCELDANARLIAAAPDLLEALRTIVDKATAPMSDGDIDLEDVKIARAAISKAEGE